MLLVEVLSVLLIILLAVLNCRSAMSTATALNYVLGKGSIAGRMALYKKETSAKFVKYLPVIQI